MSLRPQITRPRTWLVFFLFLTAISLVTRIFLGRDLPTYEHAVSWGLVSAIFYLFVFLSLVSLFFLTIRKQKPSLYKVCVSWLQRLILLFASLFLGLILVELFLRAALPRPPDRLDLRGIHRASPYSGVIYDLEPGTSRTGVGVEYKINKLGFRGKSLSVKKPDGTCRILALGDSVSFGIGVSDKNRYTEQLEDLLNSELAPSTGLRYEVMNMSVGGWNTYNELSWLRSRGMDFQPDLVIWQFHMNDVDDPMGHLGTNTFSFFREIPREYFPDPEDPTIEDNVFIRRPKDISLGSVLKWYGWKYSRTFEALNGLWRRISPSAPDPHAGKISLSWCLEYLQDENGPQWKWLRKNLEDLRDVCKEEDIPVFFLIPPLSYQLYSEKAVYREPITKLLDYTESLGFIPVSLTPRLEKESGGDFMHFYLEGDASHFNREGHRLIAGLLFETIKEHALGKKEP